MAWQRTVPGVLLTLLACGGAPSQAVEGDQTTELARLAGESLSVTLASRLSGTQDRLSRLSDLVESGRPSPDALRKWMQREVAGLSAEEAIAFTLDPRGATQLVEPMNRSPVADSVRRAAASLSGPNGRGTSALVSQDVEAPVLLFVAPLHASFGSGGSSARAWVGTLALAAPLPVVLDPILRGSSLGGRPFAFASHRILWSAGGTGPPAPGPEVLAEIAPKIPLSAASVVVASGTVYLLIPTRGADWELGLAIAAVSAASAPAPWLPIAAVGAALAALASAGAFVAGRRLAARDLPPRTGLPHSQAEMQATVSRVEMEAAHAKAEAKELAREVSEYKTSLERSRRHLEDQTARALQVEGSLAGIAAELDAERKRTGELAAALDAARGARPAPEADAGPVAQEPAHAPPAPLPPPVPAEPLSVPSPSAAEAFSNDPVDVGRLLRSVWKELVPDLQRSMLRYPMRVDDSVPEVRVDPHALRDCVLGIARQLIGQTSPGGLLELSARWHGGVLDLVFRQSAGSSGPGRPEADGEDLAIPGDSLSSFASSLGATLSVERQGRFSLYRLSAPAP